MGDPGPRHLLQLVRLRDGDVWDLDGHPRRGFLLAAEEAADEVGERWREEEELACDSFIWSEEEDEGGKNERGGWSEGATSWRGAGGRGQGA